ncbi:hypothetical protein KOR34_13400 [Posidoniimonas corsicana]|uniref:MOSC domain-containing protein n=1 Tax=Posidoniimonas corsicana TaxID=1938618 RepID=A0A5C5VFH2_9BACT|nr:MOSC N-terminal beta barrel domain-containing protein [Posidoniimonas corsicana]TWT36435.1 hypothetical protein KOR34_13400 [Posidoniimonas corsicana]
MPSVTRLTVFPIKSLDGMRLKEAEVLASGALRHDRRYALQDEAGRFVNAKRFAAVQRIRCEFDADAAAVLLACDGQQSTWFPLPQGAEEVGRWIGGRLSLVCTVVEDELRGLPDDTDAPGPTLISTASLEAIAQWFDLNLDETRRRMRANIEIDAPEPFWEDRLVGREVQLGALRLLPTGVCQRCAVPARDSQTGEPTPGFQKKFAARREACLPEASPRGVFNHFYRAALNTRLASQPGVLRVGDVLSFV